MEKSWCSQPEMQIFKAIKADSAEPIGHVQLIDIDYNTASCILGRVLVFKKFRNRGYGKAIVREAVNFAFYQLTLAEIILGVFDFNVSAITVYQQIGFVETAFEKKARQFKDEFWDVKIMKLNRVNWDFE